MKAENTKKDIVEIYKETKDFQKAVALSGLPTLVAHIKLLSSGVLELQDKIQHSSKSGRLGAEAELMFQKLIPNAVNANRVIKKNNKNFDFMYGDLTINIKYASIGDYDYRNSVYTLKRMKGCDLVVGFLERKKGAELNNPIIVVIPQAFIKSEHMSIGVNSQRLRDFTVDKKDLLTILEQYNQFIAVSKEG